MWRAIQTIILLILVIGTVVVFRAPLWVFSNQALSQIAPCRVPITYAIVSVDPGFGVTRAQVAQAAHDAVAVWEKAAGRDLFREIATGTPVVAVNLQYDLRQQTTQKLKVLGTEISNSNAQYDSAQAQYESKRTGYLREKAAFESDATAFDRDSAAYQSEVASWNRKGGAPPDVVRRLNDEKTALQNRRQGLNAKQGEVNGLADAVNALATQLNTMAGNINATARTYNKVGAQTGEEFEEGVFESRAGFESITVFEFDSRSRLTRLLAHEFGHALGLDHVEGTQSIMYRLNQNANSVPTSEDIAALKTQCRL